MISKDRDVFFDQKGWGYEQWMANSELYCGKLLVVFADKKCSIHYTSSRTRRSISKRV